MEATNAYEQFQVKDMLEIDVCNATNYWPALDNI